MFVLFLVLKSSFNNFTGLSYGQKTGTKMETTKKICPPLLKVSDFELFSPLLVAVYS